MCAAGIAKTGCAPVNRSYARGHDMESPPAASACVPNRMPSFCIGCVALEPPNGNRLNSGWPSRGLLAILAGVAPGLSVLAAPVDDIVGVALRCCMTAGNRSHADAATALP